ncbi:MAG: hypothetical protein JWO53_86, partial [Chlamydiia bacterium]|nr:hypothetical protein [Chlamydiia bacterium]
AVSIETTNFVRILLKYAFMTVFLIFYVPFFFYIKLKIIIYNDYLKNLLIACAQVKE